MRLSSRDYGWMLSADGKMQGFCLGFDFCAEHESSVTGMHQKFGVQLPENPIGIEARGVQTIPPDLTFTEYQAKPHDKRRKAYPAALLRMEPYTRSQQLSTTEIVQRLALGFFTETGEDGYKPERHDISVAWDHSDFAIHVRGKENIERLKALYQAFLSKDISLASPTCKGFRRNGPCFVRMSHVSDTERETIRQADLASERLQLAVKASGIHNTLKAAGKGWYALSPDWYDRETEEGLVFFLNPQDQPRYPHGWFNVAELEAWAQNAGPVLTDPALVAFADAHKDWEYNLVGGLCDQGLGLRHHARLEWMDADKTQVGVRIRPAKGSEARLPEGLYDFKGLTAKYPKPETAGA